MKKLISCIFCFLFYYFVLLDLRSCSALRGSVRSRPPLLPVSVFPPPRVGFSSCFCVAGLGSLSRSVVAQDSVFAAKSFPCRHRSGKGLGASKSPMGVFFSKLLNQTSVLPRFLVLPTGFGPSFLTDFLGSD
jgi:hypothetical protein